MELFRKAPELLVKTVSNMGFTKVLEQILMKLSRNLGSTTIKVGDMIPSVELDEKLPGNKVNMAELCKGKKVLIFAVPGAFTPGCSKTHLPGYLKRCDELKSKGIEEIICISVNDAFVMDAWAKEHKTEGKIRMLADADASYTSAMTLQIHLPALGGVRSKRYSMIVEDLVVKQLSVEPDGTGLTCSLADNIKI